MALVVEEALQEIRKSRCGTGVSPERKKELQKDLIRIF